MMRRWLVTGVAIASIAWGLRVHGDPVLGEVFPMRQPDGTHIDVRVWGDEFYRVVESLDGYTLVRDPKSGIGCYARLSPDGNELISTGVPVNSASPGDLGLEPHLRISAASVTRKAAAARKSFLELQAQALESSRSGDARDATTCSGNVQGIVLLVDFDDEPGTIPTSEVDDYCNLEGYTGYGNNGSVRDYFHDVSDGHLTYTNFVPTVYYRALHDKSYYEDLDIPSGVRAKELMLEALNDLEDNGFDFSQYDSNGDGLIDAINCFYAGFRGDVWAAGLWPHSGIINFSADGVSAQRYQMTDLRNELLLRTFCHENGHMLCAWPDLYDYGYESAGVGYFCLMCYGTSSKNPQEPSAYMKYIAGWSTTTILGAPQSGLTVPSDPNVAYKYEHPTQGNEYYLIENRQQTGRDSGLPDAGLAIWHVDTLGNNSYEQMTTDLHYLVTLVQADGEWALENGLSYGDETDLWKAPPYTDCTPDTDPSTFWWDFSPSGLYVNDISESSSTMTFNYTMDCNHNSIPDELDIAGSTSSDCNGNGIPDECETDCQANGVPDDCDIATGTSEDCNGSGVPDECEIAGGGVLLDVDFEDGLPPTWLATGVFQVTDLCGAPHPSCGGGSWAYAGNTPGCVYNHNDVGSLTAPPVTIGYGRSELRFCSRINTEATWDVGRVVVGGTVVWEGSGDSGGWEEYQIDLQAFAGRTVTIKFEFAADVTVSGTLGWQVDNVYLSTESQDCNSNDIPDQCDIANGTVEDTDCGGNGIPDLCEPDCNVNEVVDSCDIEAETSEDCNTNGIPDECESDEDCNSNGVRDFCDLVYGTSEDCQPNGVPDDCETDSDGDGVIDGCDGCPDDINKTDPGLCGCGVSDDDGDGDTVPDCLDVCPGFDDLADADDDDVPDGCDNCALYNPRQRDCQPNGIGDVCDLDSGTSEDCNDNGIPDECDIAEGTSADANGNGLPDECDVLPPAAEPGGLSCVVSGDCTGAWVGADCVDGTCYVPKNRYLSIDPATNNEAVALHVQLTEAVDYSTAVGRAWWVDVPRCYDYPNGQVVVPTPPTCDGADRFGWVSRLTSSPVARVWTEMPLHLTDCGIVPAAVYALRASNDGGVFLSPGALEMSTAHRPEGPSQTWGDVTGGPVSGMPGLWLPPEGTTNFADVSNAIRTFENRVEDTGFPPRVWVDVEINQVINLGDVQFIVNAFEGLAYADIADLEFIGVHPADCP